MNKKGPIIIIEDDMDDQLLFQTCFSELEYSNELMFFTDGETALNFLNGEGEKLIPFLIISDINMPKLDGFALRDKIKLDAKLQIRCIPYLFFTSALTQDNVIAAYEKSIQGFFLKPNSLDELKKIITLIMGYWKYCASPNNFIKYNVQKNAV
ncbi:MAG: response regulator [Ferruginibacter sp.]